MMVGQVPQCARVDTWPRMTGRANLPQVQPGSATAACVICHCQVWVSKPAQSLVASGEMQPVCEACKPAELVRITPEP